MKHTDILSVHKCSFVKDGETVVYYRALLHEWSDDGEEGVSLAKITADLYTALVACCPLGSVDLLFDRYGRIASIGGSASSAVL